MTQQERQRANESWTYYRSAFTHRSHDFPKLSIFISLIDRICELGYNEQLYASASLDNLVVSVLPAPRDRRQTILVIPQENTIEFRHYPKAGEAEVATVARDQAASTLDRLLSRLAENLDRLNGETEDSDARV